MTQSIQDGKVVSFHYVLTDDEGNQLDSSPEGQALPYLHGAGNIVPGLESELAGREVGDKLDVTVPPAKAYGERKGPGAQAVPRSAFPEGADIQPGMVVGAQGPDGQPVHLYVTKVEDEQIWLDPEHPLAGKTLHFSVEIASIRDATEEEQAHGHVHQ